MNILTSTYKTFFQIKFIALFIVLFGFLVSVQYAEAWVLEPWKTPAHQQIYELSDDIVIESDWNLLPGEVALIKTYIDGAEQERYIIVPKNGNVTGTISTTTSAADLGPGDHQIYLSETRTVVADCTSVATCTGDLAVWESRTFTIKDSPDPLLKFSFGNPTYDFTRVSVNATATIEFTVTNVGTDMDATLPLYTIGGTNAAFTCVEINGSVCSYAPMKNGSTTKVAIQFKPTLKQQYGGLILFPLGGGLPDQVLNLNGIGVFSSESYLRVHVVSTINDWVSRFPDGNYDQDSSIVFTSQYPDTPTGSYSNKHLFYIYNDGSKDLIGTLTGFDGQSSFHAKMGSAATLGSSFTWDGTPRESDAHFVIKPGGNAYFYLRFEPLLGTNGMQTPIFIITDTITNDTVTLDISGNAIDGPILDVLPFSLQNYIFKNIMLDFPVEHSFYIQNDGGGTLTTTATVTTEGGSSGSFLGLENSIACAFCSIAGLTTTESFYDKEIWGGEFTPTTLGFATGTVDYVSNGGNETKILTANVVGFLAESFDVASSTIYYSGQNYVIDFGKVTAGSAMVTADIKISNSALATSFITGSFSIFNIFGADFNYQGINTYNIAQGGSTNITLTYTPPPADELPNIFYAVIRFTGLQDSVIGGNMNILLRAEVIAPNIDFLSPAKVESAKVLSQAFKPTRVGESSTAVFRVHNAGTNTLFGSATTTDPFSCNQNYDLNQIKILDSFGPTWVPGVKGSALNLEDEYQTAAQKDDYVTIQDVSGGLDIVGNQITLSSWVRMNDSQLDDVAIVHTRSNSLTHFQLGIEGRSSAFVDNLVNFKLNTNIDGALYLKSNKRLIEGKWQHVVGVYNGAEAILYLDGEEVGRQTWTGDITSSTNDIFIGRAPYFDSVDSRFLNAAVDEVRIYSRALDWTEIQTLYHLGPEPTPGPAGYWSFDVPGDMIADDSGNGNVGIITYNDNVHSKSNFILQNYTDGSGVFKLTSAIGSMRWVAPYEWFEWATPPLRHRDIDPSYDIFEMRYKNYIGGPDSVTLYYRDNEDCAGPTAIPMASCSQVFSLVNIDANWHTISEKITNPTWVDYSPSAEYLTKYISWPDYFALYFKFSGTVNLNENISLDYVRFKQDALPGTPGSCTFELEPNEARYIPITFTPTTLGTTTGSVTFTDGDPLKTKSETLYGVGIGDGGLAVEPLEIDFGTVSKGSSSTLELTLYNESGTAITGHIRDANARPLSSSGTGLLTTYYYDYNQYNNWVIAPDNPVLATWMDTKIAHYTFGGLPEDGLRIDAYALRWEGKIEATETGDFSFWMGSNTKTVDHYMWVWVNDTLVGECNFAQFCKTASIPMIEGHFYDIRVEFSERWGSQRAYLYWETPSSGGPVEVPTSQMYTDDLFATINNGMVGGDPLPLTNTSAGVFTCEDADCTYNLLAYSHATTSVTFTPATDTNYARSLYFGGGNGQTVLVNATGSIDSEISIQITNPIGGAILGTCVEGDTSVCFDSVGTVIDAINPIDYGEVNVGEDISFDFTITNTGINPLTGVASFVPVSPGEFLITSTTTFDNLPTGSSETITVTFLPTPFNPTTLTATLKLFNSTTGRSIIISLTAVGLYEPTIAVNSGVLDFGWTRINTTKLDIFRVVNRGADSLDDYFDFSASGVFSCLQYQVVEELSAGTWTPKVGFGPTLCNVQFSIPRDDAVELTMEFSPLLVQTYTTIVPLVSQPTVQLNLMGVGQMAITDFIFEER